MANLTANRVKMPSQDPAVRSGNFLEVALGYTEEEALLEASRCLSCKHKPCVAGCPVGIDIPSFIQKITQKDYEGAYQIIQNSSSLPAVCGRVCPQENQCEGKCVRGIKSAPVAIGNLERFVADYHNANAASEAKKPLSNGVKVAVVGSGPAGLTFAGDLAKKGYEVTVFEALHKAGGVLSYGIPEFRLPKSIVEKEVENLKALGVTVVTDVVIGRTFTVEDLKAEGYKAVFLGSGAGLPRFMNIPGENLCGVFSANEYLTRINLMKAYEETSATPVMRGQNVIVVGGGNVAMDAARSAKRLGADVTIVYRRSMEELPARKEEVEHAKEEGVNFALLRNPVEILGNENKFVTGVRLIKMELGEPDERGRRAPVVIAGSEYDIPADLVIVAVGTSPNPLLKKTTPGLATEKFGGITADEEGRTSLPFVYAGGDAVTGAATVILAMGAGKLAAKAAHEDLVKAGLVPQK